MPPWSTAKRPGPPTVTEITDLANGAAVITYAWSDGHARTVSTYRGRVLNFLVVNAPTEALACFEAGQNHARLVDAWGVGDGG